ncbi:PLB1 Phospholipase, partial [Polypterus senegalus]
MMAIGAPLYHPQNSTIGLQSSMKSDPKVEQRALGLRRPNKMAPKTFGTKLYKHSHNQKHPESPPSDKAQDMQGTQSPKPPRTVTSGLREEGRPPGCPVTPLTSLSSFPFSAHRSGLLDALTEILQMFNPGVSRLPQLNVDTSSLAQQAKELVSQLKDHQGAEGFKQDWKVVVIFVGLAGSEAQIPLEDAKEQVDEALGVLRDQVPRALVKLVLEQSECPDGTHGEWQRCSDNSDSDRRSTAQQLSRAVLSWSYQTDLQRHLQEWSDFSQREDFAVVLQDVRGQVGRHLLTNTIQSEPILEDGTPVSSILQLWNDMVHGSRLSCEDRNPSSVAPQSVHALRPADVKVVAAIGDSLTVSAAQCCWCLLGIGSVVPIRICAHVCHPRGMLAVTLTTKTGKGPPRLSVDADRSNNFSPWHLWMLAPGHQLQTLNPKDYTEPVSDVQSKTTQEDKMGGSGHSSSPGTLCLKLSRP